MLINNYYVVIRIILLLSSIPTIITITLLNALHFLLILRDSSSPRNWLFFLSPPLSGYCFVFVVVVALLLLSFVVRVYVTECEREVNYITMYAITHT